MSASDAAPLPRLGEVFFDVRGDSRTMRLSWYADTGIAVFSIWHGGTCTGTFRLPIADLPRMVEALRQGPLGPHVPDQDEPPEDGQHGNGPADGEWDEPGAGPLAGYPGRPADPDVETGQTTAAMTAPVPRGRRRAPAERDDPLVDRDDPLGDGGGRRGRREEPGYYGETAGYPAGRPGYEEGPYPGDPYPEDAGQPGEPYWDRAGGGARRDQPYRDGPYPGESYPGEPYPQERYPGPAGPDEPYPQERYPGPAGPDEPYLDGYGDEGSYPDEPYRDGPDGYGDDPYPGEAYPDRPGLRPYPQQAYADGPDAYPGGNAAGESAGHAGGHPAAGFPDSSPARPYVGRPRPGEPAPGSFPYGAPPPSRPAGQPGPHSGDPLIPGEDRRAR